MVNNRNGFTYVANICVLSVSLVLFIVITNSATCFTVLCLSSLCVGGITTIFYSVNITEKSLSARALEMEASYRKTLVEPVTVKS